MDGGMVSRPEETFNLNTQQKTFFLLMKMKSNLSGWLSVLPCCIQREADEITTLLIAVFALKS
jgi:hypothetical protein